MAADFNDSFWVAVAAAAPVIALASAVAADSVIKEQKRRKDEGHGPSPAEQAGYFANCSNIVLQALILLAALTSLAGRHDTLWKSVAIFAEVVGLMLVFVPTLVASVGVGRVTASRAPIEHTSAPARIPPPSAPESDLQNSD